MSSPKERHAPQPERASSDNREDVPIPSVRELASVDVEFLDSSLPELSNADIDPLASTEAGEFVLPLVRIKRDGAAEARAAVAEARDLIVEVGDEDIIEVIDELEAIEREMKDAAADADRKALKEMAPDDGRRIDVAVDLLEHRPTDIAELDGLKFSEPEILAIAFRLARRNPEAFLTAAETLDFRLTPDERIIVSKDILERDSELFSRAVWELKLSNEEIRAVLASAPMDTRSTALAALKVPGTVGGRTVAGETVKVEKKKQWYEKLLDQLRTKEDVESDVEKEVGRYRAAGRELQMAIERAFPDRVGPERRRAEIEEGLHGKIEALDDLGAGSANAPMWLRFAERPVPAVYKPRNRETPLRPGIPVGTYASREWLAYQIDKALQLDLVPPTVLRDGPEGVGAVQDWKVGAAQDKRHWLLETRSSGPAKEEIAKIAFFDMIVQNSDRHAGNWLRGPDGKAIGIDHGSILGKRINGWDGVRSWPAWAVEGEKLPQGIIENVQRLAGAKDVQRALYGAFEAALGKDDAPQAWREFASRLDGVVRNGFPTADDLKREGNSWVDHDRKARDIYEGRPPS